MPSNNVYISTFVYTIGPIFSLLQMTIFSHTNFYQIRKLGSELWSKKAKFANGYAKAVLIEQVQQD